ncbi:hypothetical protein niasHT_024699 [Heterodera trifolii]|uniref:Gem-associated protein 8 n=1 Tax=Heterodera trifolii TaxID=157864 RepID=A0ABD2K3A6_9BILA
MPKKAKYAKREWRDSDFVSFWEHYAKVQEWVHIESECRQNAMEDWEWRRAEKQCISLLSLAAAHLGSELDTTADESANSTDDGGTNNGNRMPKRGADSHGQEEDDQHQTLQDAAPLNELDASAVYLSSSSAKRKKCHKKAKQRQQEQKWPRKTHWNQQQMEDEEQGEEEKEDGNESMDEQMKAFRKTTLDHRKQWEQKKRDEQQKAKQRQGHRKDEEEYFDASKMSFKAAHLQQTVAAVRNSLVGGCGTAAGSANAIDGDAAANSSAAGGGDGLATRAREYRRHGLYGEAGVTRLGPLESELRAYFDAHFAKHMPDTWPNIPLRF